MKIEGWRQDFMDAVDTVWGRKPYNTDLRTAAPSEERIRLRNAEYQVIGNVLLVILSIGLLHAIITRQPKGALLYTSKGVLLLDIIQWSRNEYHNADPMIKAENRTLLGRVLMINEGSPITEAKMEALIKAHLSLADTLVFLPLRCAMIKLTYKKEQT